ncbi:MAG: SufD family Fe-S cluster assembly protein [Rikenellaceae bacterium]
MSSTFIENKCDSVFCGTVKELQNSALEVDSELFGEVVTRELNADSERDVFKRLPSFRDFKKVGSEVADYVIYVKEAAKCEDFISLNLKDSAFDKFLIVAEKSSKFKIFVNNKGVENKDFTFVLCLKSDSYVEFVQSNSDCGQLNNFVYVEQAENSVFKSFSVSYSVKGVKNYVKNSMNTPNVESHFYGVSLIDEGENVENNIIVGHFKEQCNSTQHFKAVVSAGGKSVFNGRIYVAKDAQQTEAYQQSNNILLGEGAIAQNLPQLEIYADDVKCSHGATTGELDAEAIFYMRQRGILEQEAKKLQISGFVSNIIQKISSENIKNAVLEDVSFKLSNLN